jgi:hypothetical protein
MFSTGTSAANELTNPALGPSLFFLLVVGIEVQTTQEEAQDA